MRLVRPVLALVAIAASVTSASSSVNAQDLVAGDCTDNVGITVVVDFQELGGGVNVACAPGAVANGLDALTQAGISWDSVLTTPGFVCRIAGKPGADTESCGHTPPASAYWSYWVAPRGGQAAIYSPARPAGATRRPRSETEFVYSAEFVL